MTAELVKETPVAVDDGTSVDPAASHVTSEPIAVEVCMCVLACLLP